MRLDNLNKTELIKRLEAFGEVDDETLALQAVVSAVKPLLAPSYYSTEEKHKRREQAAMVLRHAAERLGVRL